MATIELYGVKFLECDKGDCDWNIGYTPQDMNRFGLEFTFREGVGTRVCNYGSKAFAFGKNIDRDCPHKEELFGLLGEIFNWIEFYFHRFWGRVDPDVAKRALDSDRE